MAPSRIPRPRSAVSLGHAVREREADGERARSRMRQHEEAASDRYELLDLIGKGSTSTVYHARRLVDGERFAYKLIRLSGFSESQRREILNEVDVMSHLRHPSVVAYEESFVQSDMLHIIMELLPGGDLAQEVESRARGGGGGGGGGGEAAGAAPSGAAQQQPFPEEAIWAIVVQVCEGLHHMHDRRVLHRDIKAENIFCDGHGAVKIGDLGLGRLLSSASTHARTGVGTPLYFSPEMCDEKPYNQKSDVRARPCSNPDAGVRSPPLAAGRLSTSRRCLADATLSTLAAARCGLSAV